jgi:hypothetical protein
MPQKNIGGGYPHDSESRSYAQGMAGRQEAARPDNAKPGLRHAVAETHVWPGGGEDVSRASLKAKKWRRVRHRSTFKRRPFAEKGAVLGFAPALELSPIFDIGMIVASLNNLFRQKAARGRS